MNGQFNLDEFVSKIDWEGGAFGALEYGIRLSDYELPKEASDKWLEIQEVYGDLAALISEFYAIAETYGVDY